MEKFQTAQFQPKQWPRSLMRGCRLRVMITLRKFLYLGNVVADGRWALTRGCRIWMFDSIDHFHIPIIHFVCPLNFAHTIVFNFSWKHAGSQEKLKTIVYAKFGGQTKCVMGMWKWSMFSQILIPT